MKKLILIFLLFLIPEMSVFSDEKVNIPDDTVISLEQNGESSYNGEDSSYIITIDASGKLIYEGKRNATVMGHQEKTLTRDQLLRIIEKINTIKFMELADQHNHSEITCFSTDTSLMTISITLNNVSQKVQYTCGEFRDKFNDLARAIEEIAETKEWSSNVPTDTFEFWGKDKK